MARKNQLDCRNLILKLTSLNLTKVTKHSGSSNCLPLHFWFPHCRCLLHNRKFTHPQICTGGRCKFWRIRFPLAPVYIILISSIPSTPRWHYIRCRKSLVSFIYLALNYIFMYLPYQHVRYLMYWDFHLQIKSNQSRLGSIVSTKYIKVI